MELKPGYKQSEVGVIPDDWEVKPIARIAPLQRGFDLPTSKVDEGLYPVVYSNGVLNYHKTPMVKGPGVVTGRSGTLGRVHFVESDYWPHNTSLWVTHFNENNPRFIYYLYTFIGFERFASGTGVPTLNRNDAHTFQVAIPKHKAEQQAIAVALSDADTLIASLEQIIAKKRQIKQGAMQELLTSKTRLPGFSGEWETVQIKDLLSYERPDRYIVQDTKYLAQGDIPVLTANKSFILGYTVEDFGICSDLPVVVFDDFTTDSKYADFPFKVKSSAIKLLRPRHDRVDLRFVFERIQLIQFPLGDHKRYYISEYQNLELSVPIYEEQQAIIAVLSDMDAEIAALKGKLAKARLVKHGMMQELLTGRIRLV